MTPRRDVHGWSFAMLAVGSLFVGPVAILAQSSTVVCGSSFGWMNNSKNQNPCVVAAYLQGACNDGLYFVGPLPNNVSYIGPTTEDQNECNCSTVTYSTMSACAACQNHEYISYISWAYNCTTDYQGVFTPGIPDGTAVPQWAFQDLRATHLFNVTLAEFVGDNPESTATHVQSTTSLGTTSTLPSASLTESPSTSGSSRTSSSTPTATQSQTRSGGSSTGVIVGSAVGSVVGIALVAGAMMFFVLKKNCSPSPSSAILIDDLTPPASPPPHYADIAPSYFQMTSSSISVSAYPSAFPSSEPSVPTMTDSASKIRDRASNHSNPSGHPSGAPDT